MPVQWTITVRHQAMEILRGERGKKHSSLKLWLLCLCSCILSLLQQLLGPFSFVIFLSRQIKGPGDTKWHAKSDTGKEMCKRWWICSLENDREKTHNVFLLYSIPSKPGHELFLVNHRISHGILGFPGTWVLAILAPNSCKLWGLALGTVWHCPSHCIALPSFFFYFFSLFLKEDLFQLLEVQFAMRTSTAAAGMKLVWIGLHYWAITETPPLVIQELCITLDLSPGVQEQLTLLALE